MAKSFLDKEGLTILWNRIIEILPKRSELRTVNGASVIGDGYISIGVATIDSLEGDIELKKDSDVNGTVNFNTSDNIITGSVYGLKDSAFTEKETIVNDAAEMTYAYVETKIKEVTVTPIPEGTLEEIFNDW